MLRASFQSWITLLRMIASAIAGTDLKKSPATNSTRSLMPICRRCLLAASAHRGRSKTVPRSLPVLLRDGAEQFAGPAADVHQVRYPAEIVGAKDIRRDQPRELRHRRIELVDVLRCSTHQFETVGEALQFRRRLAGHDGFKHSAPALRKHLGFKDCPALERLLRFAVEAGTHLRQSVRTFASPFAYPDGGERGEQTPKRPFIRAGCLCEFSKRLRSVPQQLGNPEFDRHVDYRGHTVRLNQDRKA